MSFLELLRGLFFEGRIHFSGPVHEDGADEDGADEREVAKLLEQAFMDYRRSVAGPELAFDRSSALAAARFVARSAWYLFDRQETDAVVEQQLRLPSPLHPSQHLSGDLLLRHLPQIHRRAWGFNPADALSIRLAEVLRHWPLSGVLADLTDGPLTPLDFGGHPGLLMLYAERLAEHFKPAWVPEGAGREYLELVWTELGRDVALLQDIQP